MGLVWKKFLARSLLAVTLLPTGALAYGPETLNIKSTQGAQEIQQSIPASARAKPKPPTPPRKCPFEKVCLFPLNFPYLFLKSLTYPISYGAYQVRKNKKLYKTFQFITNTDRNYSFYPKLWIGDGGNIGGGFGFTHADLMDRNYLFNFEYLLFTNLAMRGRILFGNNAAFYIFNRAFSFWIVNQFWREFHQDYYGLGNASLSDNHSIYSRNRIRSGFEVGFELIPDLVLSNSVFIDFENSGTGKNGLPSVQQTFPADQIPGFGRNLPYFVYGFRLEHDTRDDGINSQSGGRRLFSFDGYLSLNEGQFDFSQYRILAEQYFPVGPLRYVLVVRNQWIFQDSSGGNVIPFYRLAQLDFDRGLRAFRNSRFRDTSSVIFNIEQRFPLWDIVDGVVFFDTGRVFPGIKGFSFNNFKYSAGGGIRIYLGPYYVALLDVAYGNDGTSVQFKLRNTFYRGVN